MRYYGYEEFILDMRRLKLQLAEQKIDAIVFALRGGATMAHILSIGLDVKKVYAINADSYSCDIKLHSPKIENIPQLPEDTNRILVLDEIIDSGETMAEIVNVLKLAFPKKRFITASIFQRPTAIFKADFFIQTTDEWIDFFWEKDLQC
jgi:xanthine phosphoribosyltransferase